MIFGFLAPLLFLAILATLVVVIVAAVRRGAPDEEEEPGIGTLRRVFYYLLGFIALSVAAMGLCLLLSTVLDPVFGDDVILANENRLALGLALTVVGTPIWLFLWGRSLQAVRQYPAEGRSLGRKLYINLVMGIAGIAAAVSLVSMIRWAFRIQESSSVPWAILLVMAGLWLFHRRADAGESEGRGLAALMPRLYWYGTALYGLVMLAAGTGMVLGRLLMDAYDAVFQTPLLGSSGRLWERGVREWLSVALVGGAWWAAHWGWMAGPDRPGPMTSGAARALPGLRQLYLYVFAVFGGAITTVIATAMFLYGLFSWVVGVPSLGTAAEHFRFIPGVVAGLVVGLALWGYHHYVIREEAPGSEEHYIGARRGYQYLVSAVGLGTLAAGLTIAFGMALGVMLPQEKAIVAGEESWKRMITLAMTLIAVGAPLWGYYWFGVQREGAADPYAERGRLSRRTFIYGVFCIALLLLLGNLSALLFNFLLDAFEGDFGARTVQDAKWFMASLLMAGAISVYYGFVLREDRRVREEAAPPAPEAAAVRKRVTAIAAPEAGALVQRVEAALGYPVTWWRALDGSAGVPALDEGVWTALPGRIAEAPGDRVVLLIDAGGVRVLPYGVE